MEWISVKTCLPPKNGKFLFRYHYGVGLGNWGRCYKIINGNSEYDQEKYILILWPSEIVAGERPFEWDEEYLTKMDIEWMLPP
jgi:hypothetical protein